MTVEQLIQALLKASDPTAEVTYDFGAYSNIKIGSVTENLLGIPKTVKIQSFPTTYGTVLYSSADVRIEPEPEERRLHEHGSMYYLPDNGEFLAHYAKIAEGLELKPIEDLETGGLYCPRNQVAPLVRYLNSIPNRTELYGDIHVMCKEYGDDDDWNEITPEDLDNNDEADDELDADWKTFCIW